MQGVYRNICSIPTHIITWGQRIEESFGATKEIAICITGNPGLPGFYTEFLENLYNQLDNKMPVWVIGHAGHGHPPELSMREVPELKGNEELFDLKAQIQHKIEFIEKYVPPDVKIHLIGHSIGAWMILQILEHETIRSRIAKCYLLFPTIERMMESPNGWVFTKIVQPLYSVFGFLVALFNRLPKALILLLIQLYFWLFDVPKVFLYTAFKYSKASVVQKVIFLAEDEMARVRGLQRELLAKHLPLLKFYYGTTDGWVPVNYYQQLKTDFPAVDAQLDSKNIEHAFVLRSAKPMAVIVADMIRSESKTLQ